MPFGEAGRRQDGTARSRTGRGLIRVWDTQSLEEHVSLMKRQVDRSCADPETLQLARKITAGKPDAWETFRGERWPIVEAWGEGFILPSAGSRCPMRDTECELGCIWDFVVANVRYVYDPPDYDLFCTAEYTLKAGAGDCLPGYTRLLVRDRHGHVDLMPISRVAEGDEHFDGTSWVKVTKWWDKGQLRVRMFELANGQRFECTDAHRLFVCTPHGEIEQAAIEVEVGAELRSPEGSITVVGVERLERPMQCYDIETKSHRVWLPESNVVCHNCDDMTIVLASLQKCAGFSGVAARVVTQSGESWEHVYDMCALEKDGPRTWVAFDPTVKGVEAGWQFDGVKDYRDFYL